MKTRADEYDTVSPDDLTLTESFLGYTVSVDGEAIGSIEGTPGKLEYLVIEPHWEGKGAARAALKRFVERTRAAGHETVTTNNAVHDAMEHILETEGFEHRPDEGGWAKDL
jgi:GNAT superfamily N-acetyltransferase